MGTAIVLPACAFICAWQRSPWRSGRENEQKWLARLPGLKIPSSIMAITSGTGNPCAARSSDGASQRP
eukprot:2963112-Pyramimonas_sp.AAC.1